MTDADPECRKFKIPSDTTGLSNVISIFEVPTNVPTVKTNVFRRSCATDVNMQFTELSEVQDAVSQRGSATMDVAEKLYIPRFSPETVNEEPPQIAKFIEESEMEGASNEYRASPVPTMPVTETASVPRLLAVDAD